MDIRWVTGFLDLPAPLHERGRDFWRTVTASTLSPPRGPRQEFATLIPAAGDPFLRVQRIDDGHGGVHLDLHVDSVRESVDHALAAGAEITADNDTFVVFASPGGLPFCLVEHNRESIVPPSRSEPVAHVLDQICIDVPAHRFAVEARFWGDLTGWSPETSTRFDEFAVLRPPPADSDQRQLPLRLLLQRLGVDDERPHVCAHFDFACGGGAGAVAENHVVAGAERIGTGKYWIDMVDPAGFRYCLTRRDL